MLDTARPTNRLGTAAALLTPAPSAEVAVSNGRITITAEELAANLAGRDEATIETLEWFRAHCVLRGLTWDAAARRLPKGTDNGSTYSRNSIYQALTGARKLDVSFDPLCAAIERYRRKAEAPAPEGGFIRTRLSGEIETYVQRCRAQQKIGFIVGENACGKTTAIEELARTDARVRVVRMREGGHLSAFLKALAARLGFGERQTVANYSDKLIAEFRPDDVLVIDEGEECFNARSSVLGSKTLTFIRRLFDEARCSVVFVMDPFGFKKLQTVRTDDPLRKVYSRREAPLILPGFYREDLDLFSARHGLPPAPHQPLTVSFRAASGKTIEHTDNPQEVQDRICSSHRDGLFVWLGLLKQATELARAADKDVSWGWVLKAHALFAVMESEARK